MGSQDADIFRRAKRSRHERLDSEQVRDQVCGAAFGSGPAGNDDPYHTDDYSEAWLPANLSATVVSDDDDEDEAEKIRYGLVAIFSELMQPKIAPTDCASGCPGVL